MAAAHPKTMRAWIVTRNGDPRAALSLKPDWPAPPPPTGSDLLIKVSHASLNPADVHHMRILPTWIPFRRNPIPGLDFAGTVVVAGPSAPKDLGPGVEVCGAFAVTQVARGKGALGEYVLVSAEQVVKKGASLSLAQGAGVYGVAGQTTFIALREGNVKAGDRVLVNGASGGVGSLIVQVLKAKGAVVTAVCSGANEGYVKKLGADQVVDYTKHSPLATHLVAEYEKQPFDLIFDCIGSWDLFDNSPKYLKPQGQLICIDGGKYNGVASFLRNRCVPSFLGGVPRTYKLVGLMPSGAFAREVAKWVDEGAIKQVPIDSEFSMDKAVEAYEKVATKRSKGKVIVKVQP